MDPVDVLLKLYGRHAPEVIEGDGSLLLAAFNVAGSKELLAIEGYAIAFDLVSTRAAAVASLARQYAGPLEQARESVRLLRDMLDTSESEDVQRVTRKLVEDRLRATWPADVQRWYDDKVAILEWRDFFISYTDRDAPAQNQQFRSLITKCLGTFPKGTALQTNHVARVITRYLLSHQGLRGFFAETDLKPGEQIRDAVNGYCERAFALVQLIEPLTFGHEPPRNWCHHEYRRFTDHSPLAVLPVAHGRHFFVLTDDDFTTLEPVNPAAPQREWHARIQSLKQTHIGLRSERDQGLRLRIRAIAQQIVSLRAAAIQAWLDH